MRRVFGALLLLILVTLPRESRAADWRRSRERCDPNRDVALITAHLTRVEALLRARDSSRLNPEQRRARRLGLSALREYIALQQYPRNRDFPGRRVPYFIDADGRACAVAQLVIASGHRELADAVANDQNNAYLADMSSPELTRWIASSGFTFDELALIQPSYCGWCDPVGLCDFAYCDPPAPMWGTCVRGPMPDGTACYPPSVCVKSAACQFGQCKTTAEISCDDKDDCTIDSCDPTLGCQHEAKTCDDADPCTLDTCDPSSGCHHRADDCDDGDPCTLDFCDDIGGCRHKHHVCDAGPPASDDAGNGSTCAARAMYAVDPRAERHTGSRAAWWVVLSALLLWRRRVAKRDGAGRWTPRPGAH